MNNNVLLITKDALCKEYLPIYGNQYWKGKTPNIDELSSKGTVFDRHITAAPSTVMAFRAMVTGKFAHEQPYANYKPKEVPGEETDLFQYAEKMGYSGHIIWDQAWDTMVLRYGNCYGPNTIIHSIPELRQGVGCHYNHIEPLKNNDDKCKKTLERIIKEVENIIKKNNKILLWIHLPHVINGRTAYGSDIDVFDDLIGRLRKLFDDDNIFISADHGNMNAHKGKYCYGFDVNTSAVEIPLISPRICGYSRYSELTSNVDIRTLMFERVISERTIIYSDCAYYAQPHRKLVIYKNDFAYIYNKLNRKEELYDVTNDHYELCNLCIKDHYDIDRKLTSPTREYYFSPHWDNVDSIIQDFRNEKDKIWRNAPRSVEIKEKYLRKVKNLAVGILKTIKK